MDAKIDMEALSRSLTGFDEIAICNKFHREFTDLPGTRQARALLFISKKREGMTDADAFKLVMDLPLGELEGFFDTESLEGKA
jgi:hypothetical protein